MQLQSNISERCIEYTDKSYSFYISITQGKLQTCSCTSQVICDGKVKASCLSYITNELYVNNNEAGSIIFEYSDIFGYSLRPLFVTQVRVAIAAIPAHQATTATRERGRVWEVCRNIWIVDHRAILTQHKCQCDEYSCKTQTSDSYSYSSGFSESYSHNNSRT